MRVIRFTDLAGNPVGIIDTWVQVIRYPVEHEYQDNCKVVLEMSSYRQAVQEDFERAVALLQEEEGF